MKIIDLISKKMLNFARNLAIKSHEPQIKPKRNRYGNLYWQVYDYRTNKFYEFGSEQEVRVWLDNRYHFYQTTCNNY